MNTNGRIDYVIIEATGNHWPGMLPYRGRDSRVGYPTREAAEARARVVNRHYNATHGQGLDLRVTLRHTPDDRRRR